MSEVLELEIQLNFFKDSGMKRSALMPSFNFMVDVGAALKLEKYRFLS